MISWLSENLGTILISALLIAAVLAVILKMRRDRKNGKSSCGCNCGCCAMAHQCHTAKKDEPSDGKEEQL